MAILCIVQVHMHNCAALNESMLQNNVESMVGRKNEMIVFKHTG